VTATIDTDKVVVDSSGWLEYLTSDNKADAFAAYLEGNLSVLVPTIVLYEVRKILLLKEGRTEADIFLSQALRRVIVPFDEDLAIKAAEVALVHKLPMADAIIYATAVHFGAQLVTSDAHFEGLPGARVV
jgi:predicted nucleic acid-binding protein